MRRLISLSLCLLLCSLTHAVPPMQSEDGSMDYPMRHRQRVARPALQKTIGKRMSGRVNLAPRGLLILVEFPDVTFKAENTRAAFDSLANADNYVFDGATGSTRAYYRAQSNGQYVPDFDVVGPVQLPHEMAYYGANNAAGYDQNTGDFVMDAVNAADSLGVDFTLYDNNQDGYIDLVYILYAGYSESDSRIANTIWPHYWDLMSNFYEGYTRQTTYYYHSETDFRLPQYDGLFLNEYACSACLRPNGERAGIGTFSHEFGHVLGLPDYYSTVRGLHNAYTPGSWSNMGYGCYINDGKTPCNYSVYDKYYLGWLTPQLMEHNRFYTLTDDYNDCFMVTRDGLIPTDGPFTTDTVYYIENRQYHGWDAYLPGHGMLVWRVIYDAEQWKKNTPNSPQLIGYTLLTADGSTPYNNCITGHCYEGMPFPGTENTTQLILFNRYRLDDITETDEQISFRFIDLQQPTPTDLDAMEVHPRSVRKFTDRQHLYIEKEGRCYDLLGRPITHN